MKIIIDENAGFCWGVVQTIDKVEKVLEENPDKNVSVIGEIIHNTLEIKRLEEKKLFTINYEDIEKLDPINSITVIRAHGEPPKTYNALNSNNISFIDATCPLVKKLQEKIRYYYIEGWQIIIYGKYEHAEVIGLRGVCNDECIVVRKAEEIENKIDFSKKIMLCSQTTMDKDGLFKIKDFIESKITTTDIKNNFIFKNTICNFVSNREEGLRKFAKQHELIIFVAGRNSSNGKVLFGICKAENENSIFIENFSELNIEQIKQFNNIGITGANSTPKWVLEEIKNNLTSQLVF